jgi:hypothetical protein
LKKKKKKKYDIISIGNNVSRDAYFLGKILRPITADSCRRLLHVQERRKKKKQKQSLKPTPHWVMK